MAEGIVVDVDPSELTEPLISKCSESDEAETQTLREVREKVGWAMKVPVR